MFIGPIRNFYGRFERPISSLSLVLGFVFDALTLKRVDTFWENLWVIGHILIVGVFIILIHLRERGLGDEKNPAKAHFWYVNILQFFFGGLLSTYLVFYFRSADVFVTWPFILLLTFAFIANESFKKHYVRFSFQISLFFLSVYSFFIFFIPIVFHKIGDWIFLLSGVLSLIFIGVFIFSVFHLAEEKFTESKRMVLLPIIGIFIIVNFLYFTNLIPPIPLSLKDAGVYHYIQKRSDGNYNVVYESHGWRDNFKFYEDFRQSPESPVYAYSAVFSPRGLNITIVHEWQHYDEQGKKWITEREINLPVVGGRDGGFRTYSMRTNISAGKWRVNIKTQDGKTIGRLRFNIVPSLIAPGLKSEVK